MINFTASLLALMKLIALACVVILCVIILTGLLYLITPRMPLVYVLHFIGLSHLANLIIDSTYSETSQGYIDHKAIESWIINYIGFNELETLPIVVRNIFTISSYGHSVPSEIIPLPEGTRKPNHGERALIQLSSTLTTQRDELRSKVQSAYVFWQCTSLMAIVLGMITTILVSMSSTQFGRGEGRSQQLVRIFAIIFPALGTAVAAVIAFYSPQVEWSQASRTLASVNQLHGQMALGIWKLECLEPENKKNTELFTTTIDNWLKRYHEIQTVSSTMSRGPTTGSETSEKPKGQAGQ